MEAGKYCYLCGLISGPNKADDTCGKTTVTGSMDRGFTVVISFFHQTMTNVILQKSIKFGNEFN
jgi:hypothetical protein